jgi:hypothetical protein
LDLTRNSSIGGMKYTNSAIKILNQQKQSCKLRKYQLVYFWTKIFLLEEPELGVTLYIQQEYGIDGSQNPNYYKINFTIRD